MRSFSGTANGGGGLTLVRTPHPDKSRNAVVATEPPGTIKSEAGGLCPDDDCCVSAEHLDVYAPSNVPCMWHIVVFTAAPCTRDARSESSRSGAVLTSVEVQPAATAIRYALRFQLPAMRHRVARAR